MCVSENLKNRVYNEFSCFYYYINSQIISTTKFRAPTVKKLTKSQRSVYKGSGVNWKKFVHLYLKPVYHAVIAKRYGSLKAFTLLKKEKTCFKRYGSKYFFQTDIFKDKSKKTNNIKYGADYFTASDIGKRTISEINIKKYGVPCTFAAKPVKDKMRETSLKRYGVEYPSQSVAFKDSVKATCLEKYGVECVFQSDHVIQKAYETNLKRYGTTHYAKRNLKNVDKLTHDFCINFFVDSNGLFDLEKFKTFFNVSTSKAYKLKKQMQITVPCSNESKSRVEIELQNWIEGKGFNIIRNDRNLIHPLELDIVIPDIKLAIEYNGVYWHSKKDKYYHYNKSKQCFLKGYRLIHIFEHQNLDDWKDKLLSILNNTEITEYTDDVITIDFSKDNPFIDGYKIKSFQDPVEIIDGVFNSGFLTYEKR